MSDLIITNALIITLDESRRIIDDGSIVVKDDKIIDVGKAQQIAQAYSAEKVISGKGKAVLPGLVNTHVHTIEQLERGMADELDIFPWIFTRTLPYEAALTPEEIYTASLLCCAELIKTGTTTIAEVGAHPLYYNETAQAIKDAGIRAIIGKHGMDSASAPVPPELFESTDQAITTAEQLIEQLHGKAEGRIRGSVVVTTLRAGTKELFRRSKKLADDSGVVLQVHMNVGHGRLLQQIIDEYGVTPMEYLDKINVLGPNVLLVHMSYPTTDKEVEILRTHDVKVCHCPGAALHGAYGVTLAKIPEFVEAGICVTLGSDGAPSCNFNDMVRIMYLASGIHKDVRRDPLVFPPETVLEMATIQGAKALNWENEIGSIEKGKKADLSIFNTQRPEWLPLINPVSNLVYSACGHSCETVIIDGKVIMEDKKILAFNEEELLKKATPMAQSIMSRAGLESGLKWPII